MEDKIGTLVFTYKDKEKPDTILSIKIQNLNISQIQVGDVSDQGFHIT